MKPYPFASLNHLTVPCAIRLCPLSLGRGWPARVMSPGHHGRVSPTFRGNKKAPSRTDVPAAQLPLTQDFLSRTDQAALRRRQKTGCRLAMAETAVKVVVAALRVANVSEGEDRTVPGSGFTGARQSTVTARA